MTRIIRQQVSIVELPGEGWAVSNDGLWPDVYPTAVEALRAVQLRDQQAVEAGALACQTTVTWTAVTRVGWLVVSAVTGQKPSKNC